MKTLLEKLIGRPLLPEDGVSTLAIEECEKRLSVKLPQAIKDFHLLIGNNTDFLSAYNHFNSLDELEIQAQMLVFAEENQGVLYWAISLVDGSTHQNSGEENAEWFAEELSGDEYLKLLCYFQCCMGYYESCFYVLAENAMESIQHKWTEVINHQDLHIYANEKDDALVWWLDNESGDIFFSTANEQTFEKYEEEYDLAEL